MYNVPFSYPTLEMSDEVTGVIFMDFTSLLNKILPQKGNKVNHNFTRIEAKTMSTAQIICLVLCGSAIAIALINIIYLLATRPESFKRDKRNDDTNNRDHKTKDSDH